MSSGRKKHAPSGARAKQRKKRGKNVDVQFLLPVDDALVRAGAGVADAREGAAGAQEAAVYAEGPVAGNATPQKTASDRAFLSSGRAFLLVACVCLLLLVLESERAARRLDEFAPDDAAEKAASLLRTIGRASGAVRLGEWEDSWIRHLTGNTPSGRQKTPFFAGAGDRDERSRSVGAVRSPVQKPLPGPVETAKARAGRQTAPEVSVLPAIQAVSGQRAASETSTLPANRPAVQGSPAATAETQAATAATAPQAATATAAQAASAPQVATTPQAATVPQVADTVPTFPVDVPRESAGAGATVPAGSVLSGATLASLPENIGLAGAGKERKTVLLVGDSMMGWGLGHMLERGIRAYPWISVKRYSRPSTGLCRITDVDWPKYLGDLVAEHAPDLVVISIGANDGFTMTDRNRRACTVFTPAWEKEYRRRAEEFAHIAGARGAKVLWVGLPVAGVDKTEKVLRTVSRLQQDACANYDFATYIDVRAVLTDKNGRYTTFRPGNNAEPVRIRATDKIHVSEAGGKLLADYLMPSVLKTLGGVPQENADAGRGTARVKSVVRAGKAGG
jgi:hypothetical protein